jgi:SpoVK/Ycf46/Vps4 family AAA+-type ATPase
MIIVPGSLIFDEGFDMMETRANEVFRRLQDLIGCVIFFDEFEEFFRDRGIGESQIHDRTIAAFTTPAMLPRLQELHDKGRCLIFLATNHPEKIDAAIKRPGRFDYNLQIEFPKRDRVVKYLMEQQESAQKQTKRKYEILAEMVRSLFNENENISFSCIRTIKDSKEMLDEAALKDAVRKSLLKSRAQMEKAEGDPPDLWEL